MIENWYRTYIPASFRESIYRLFLRRLLRFFRFFRPTMKSKSVYFFPFFYSDSEEKEAYRFMGKHGITDYPFPASLTYRSVETEVLVDERNGMKYVVHHGKKLFFPRSFSKEEVAVLYRSLLIEQDPESPHRYVASYETLKGRILLDVGAAEGIFALDTIEFTEKVYLFECEDYWIEALNATFAPWKEKVEIIRKYVGDQNSTGSITLDSFLQGAEAEMPCFLKMDIEGAEMAALQGASGFLRTNRRTVASICTYHRKKDAQDIAAFLSGHGFRLQFTEGFLFWDNMLRKVIVRAVKE